MATGKQPKAATANVKTAQTVAASKKTIAHLSEKNKSRTWKAPCGGRELTRAPRRAFPQARRAKAEASARRGSTGAGQAYAGTAERRGSPGNWTCLRWNSRAARQSRRLDRAPTPEPGNLPEGGPAIPLLVGTSGWQYRDWRGPFYPEGFPVARWLEYYAAAYPTVENNGTFYRLAAPKTFADWRARTPDGFVMAVKASRYLTHIRRLREPAQPVGRLIESVSQLGDRLGPVLVQLPPNMQADPGALDETLRQFAVQGRAAGRHGGKLRVCVEFRHESWFTAEIRQLLSQHDAALCWSDRRGRPLGPLWRTAGWGYLRLHEGAAQPWPRYGRQALRTWLHRIADNWPPDADVFAYFNNDQSAAAPADAAALTAMAKRAGSTATSDERVPVRPEPRSRRAGSSTPTRR